MRGRKGGGGGEIRDKWVARAGMDTPRTASGSGGRGGKAGDGAGKGSDARRGPTSAARRVARGDWVMRRAGRGAWSAWPVDQAAARWGAERGGSPGVSGRTPTHGRRRRVSGGECAQAIGRGYPTDDAAPAGDTRGRAHNYGLSQQPRRHYRPLSPPSSLPLSLFRSLPLLPAALLPPPSLLRNNGPPSSDASAPHPPPPLSPCDGSSNTQWAGDAEDGRGRRG